METKQIADIGIVKGIFETRMQRDFDPQEIKPWSQIKKLWNRNEYICHALTDAGEILGYAFFVQINSNFLLDYFAIEENYRCSGLGTLFLNQLANRLQDAACIVCEVEDPDKAVTPEDRHLRERRLHFYLRNGYRQTGVVARVFGVDFLILEIPTGKVYTSEEFCEIYTEIYRSIHPPLVFQAQFRAKVL